jgi:quercetin dioxygenase-like cupin family protein
MDSIRQRAVLRASHNDLERSVWYSGYLLTILATADDTAGAFSLVEEVGRRGQSADPPMHIHRHEEESFYVIEGAMRFYIADDVVDAPAGTLITLPRGIPHRFTLESEEVRVLNMCVPAGFEGFLRDLGEPARSMTLPPAPDGPPDIARILEVAQQYGVEILPPGE